MAKYHVTFPEQVDRFIEIAARKLDVSRSWVVRKAVRVGVIEMSRQWGIKYSEDSTHEGNRVRESIDG